MVACGHVCICYPSRPLAQGPTSLFSSNDTRVWGHEQDASLSVHTLLAFQHSVYSQTFRHSRYSSWPAPGPCAGEVDAEGGADFISQADSQCFWGSKVDGKSELELDAVAFGGDDMVKIGFKVNGAIHGLEQWPGKRVSVLALQSRFISNVPLIVLALPWVKGQVQQPSGSMTTPIRPFLHFLVAVYQPAHAIRQLLQLSRTR